MAAFGGGMILGKGIGIINSPFLKGDSLLAFFAGSVLGLFSLQLIPEKYAKNVARCFAIFAGLTSIILLILFDNFSVNGKLENIPAFIFFLFLSMRFGFWFYSRVLRATDAAGQKQKIAWVELGYYLGMIFGLIIWQFLSINIPLRFALILDVILQITAGLLDIFASQIPVPQLSPILTEKMSSPTTNKNNMSPAWRLASAVALLTVATQVIIFNLAHQVTEWFSSYIIAFYYFGVSIAAFTCKKLTIQLDWNNSFASAVIYCDANKAKQFNFLSGTTLSILSVLIITIGIIHYNWGTLSYTQNNTLLNIGWNEILLLFFITISGFLYEILALALLDRIGFEDQSSNHKKMVMRTYAMMAISAALSLWMLEAMKNSVVNLFLVLSFCLIGIALTTRKSVTV